ncbi:hypothetical protein ACP70R_046995 [Stipagrostis hirtigluma subsp. patula]
MAPESNRKARRPQFLKVLFPEFMEKMPIPAKFMRRHLAHEQGRRRATLMGPIGKFWHVDVAPGDDGDGDGACFAGGWAEFVGANAVAPGSFLVFRYEGNMVFTVKVFDASGCVREYGDGCAATSVEPTTAPERQSNGGAGWKLQPTSKIQDTSPLPQKTRKYNKRKFAYDDDIVREKQSRCPQIPIVENDFGQEQYTQTETHSDVASEAKRSGYEDSLPVYVKAVSPCNFRYSYMNIGKKFCTRNGLVTNRLMTLKDQEGRSWPVNLTLTSDQVRMKGGWGHFSGHHGIKVGDQCVFRLTDPNTFAVSINRAP